MTEATEVAATPAAQETPAEQVTTVEASSAEATTAQTQEQTPEAQEEKARKEPWFQKRIGELTREKYEGRREAEQARAEAQQLRQQLEQLQRGEQTQQPQEQVPMSLVERKAAELLAEQRFNEACNKVYEKGVSEFSDSFKTALSNLQMVGVDREFLEIAATSDAGEKLIHHLGNDLDEAARIMALPPVLKARELTKLELRLSQPTPKPVSSAPAPIKPVNGTQGGSKDPSEMTDAEFAKWRRAQIAQRN